MKKVIITAALILAAAMILSSCSLYFGENINMEVYADENKYSIGNFEYDAENIKTVDIEWIFGDITIVPGAKSGKLSVKEDADGVDEDLKMRCRVDGDTLRVKFCKSGFRSKMTPGAEKNVTVEIPDGVSLVVDAVSSDVLIGNGGATPFSFLKTFTFSKIDINTVSGKIAIEINSVLGKHAFYCENVKLSTVSGSITTEGFVNDNVLKTEDDGEMKFSLIANTVSGDVSVAGSFNEYDISTVSGNVHFGAYYGDLTFDTVSGKLKTSQPHATDGNKHTFDFENIRIYNDAKISTVSGNLTIGD